MLKKQTNLSQYKPERRFVPTNTVAETMKVIKAGDLISITTVEDSFFAKVQTAQPTGLTLQILRHNFEPSDKTIKMPLSKIVSLKRVSLKSGIGAIKKSGSALLA